MRWGVRCVGSQDSTADCRVAVQAQARRWTSEGSAARWSAQLPFYAYRATPSKAKPEHGMKPNRITIAQYDTPLTIIT